MDQAQRLLVLVLLVLAAAVGGARGNALVSGFVMCDHCRDGQITLFDYPLAGIKVTMSCTDKDGNVTWSRGLTTNILGNYAIMFDGTPDLTNCKVQVSAGQGGACMAAPGPSRELQLSSQLLDFSTYFVDSLFTSPSKLPSFCPESSSNPGPTPAKPNPSLPPPAKLPPAPPVSSAPSLPFLEASACPHTLWMKPEYKCHWKLVNPDSRVALVFGLVAGVKYGTEMTLSQALQGGGGDPYRKLLREATTALLNSYSSIRFPYHPAGIIIEVNFALIGSKQHALNLAERYMKANSGNGKVHCRFAACN